MCVGTCVYVYVCELMCTVCGVSGLTSGINLPHVLTLNPKCVISANLVY